MELTIDGLVGYFPVESAPPLSTDVVRNDAIWQSRVNLNAIAPSGRRLQLVFVHQILHARPLK